MKGWRLAAACYGAPTEWFFADENGGDWANAKQLCDTCPVQRECLDEAMTNEGAMATQHRAGMYGGVTPLERETLNRAARGLPAALHHDEWPRMEMWSQGASNEQIAAQAGCTLKAVRHWLRRRGLKANTEVTV